jgi:3-oxoacyl-[acyl-carrier protein] reductase
MTTATAQHPGRLHGRVAWVTGAGAGLGSAFAIALAREGARAVICDIDTQALQGTAARLDALGAPHLALRCDVADRAAVNAMFAQAAAFGSVDVLVDNAARMTFRRGKHRPRHQR